MNCLYCHEKQVKEVNWVNLFFSEKKSELCTNCQEKLSFIKKQICEACGRPTDAKICEDCLHWQSIYKNKEQLDPLKYNRSIYIYNDFMREIIVKWKYQGDYELGNIFRDMFRKYFSQYFSMLPKDAIIVPIPLSEERKRERAFNQAFMLASFLPWKVEDILTREHREKQAKKSRLERMLGDNPFSLIKPLNKTVVIVDDIYTTGTTLRHAAELLKKNGCPVVYSYTLIRG